MPASDVVRVSGSAIGGTSSRDDRRGAPTELHRGDGRLLDREHPAALAALRDDGEREQRRARSERRQHRRITAAQRGRVLLGQPGDGRDRAGSPFGYGTGEPQLLHGHRHAEVAEQSGVGIVGAVARGSARHHRKAPVHLAERRDRRA